MNDAMKVVGIVSQKGGTGKTTISIHLSVAAAEAGQTVVLIDLDPQASATRWSDLRASPSPTVVSAHAIRLPELLHTAEAQGASLVIIDTPPKTDISVVDILKAADLALIPTSDNYLELDAIAPTLGITKDANLPTYIVFNAIKSRSAMFYKAKRALATYDAECAPCSLGDRVAFSRSLMDGLTAQEIQPTGKAALEVKALYNYVMEVL